MLSWFCIRPHNTAPVNAPVSLIRHRFKFLSVALLLLSAGCSQFQSVNRLLRLPGQFSEVDLNLQVAATNTPGVYEVSGKTNLPDRTQLTVAAVRYLYPAKSAALNLDPTYEILDYQSVKVSQGTWQNKLNLWRVAANGQYQENWQIDQSRLGVSFKPDENVMFLATLVPVDKLSRLEQQLAERGLKLATGTVRNTLEGQRYAQVNESLVVALPTGSTTPPPRRPEEVNQGWGYRYLIPQEPQNPTKLERPNRPITNAPPHPEEFLQ